MQHPYLPIVSAMFDLVDWFRSKTHFEEIANESLLINIDYINLFNQYFLVDIVLHCSRIQNYKSLSWWLHWKINGLTIIFEWRVFPFYVIETDTSFQSTAYQILGDLLYKHCGFIGKLTYLLHIFFSNIFGIACPMLGWKSRPGI